MSWLFERKGDKFRVYSTVVDDFLTDWLDRMEAINYCYEERLHQFKLDLIQLYMTFPHHKGLYTEDGRRQIIINMERYNVFAEWIKGLFSRSEDEYEAELDAKYQEVLEQINGK